MSSSPHQNEQIKPLAPPVPVLDQADGLEDIVEFRGKSMSVSAAEAALGLQNVNGAFDAFREKQQRLNKEMPFISYLALVKEFPELAADAHQRLYGALQVSGISGTIEIGNENYPVYDFLKDPDGGGVDAMFGGDQAVHALASQLQINDKRVFVVYGPTGTGKNTLLRRLKSAFEKHSQSQEGAVMELGFKDPDSEEISWSPRRENPLHAIPRELRAELLPWMKKERLLPSNHTAGSSASQTGNSYIPLEGDLSFTSREKLDQILNHESVQGDFIKAMGFLRVRRFSCSETARRGIAAFVPKTIETNQASFSSLRERDSEGVSHSVNSKSDMTQSSDDALDSTAVYERYVRANRGLLEFQELQRLSSVVRGTLLTSAEDHVIESPEGDLEHFDIVIIGHTTTGEYEKMIQDPTVRRRVIGIPLGYNTRVDDELAIYKRDYHPGSEKVIKHIAPLALETLAEYAVLTRLEDPIMSGISLLQKLRLYNGERLPGITADQIAALREEHCKEGMTGDSPADSQNRISALLGNNLLRYVSPYDVLKEIKRDTETSQDSERVKKITALLRDKLDQETLKHIKESWQLDDNKLQIEYDRYLDEVKAYTQKETRAQHFTGQQRQADETFMRSIEELAGIPESGKDSFRSQFMTDLGALSLDDKIPAGQSSYAAMIEKRNELRGVFAKKLGISASVANLGELLERVREQMVGPGVENARVELQEAYDTLHANLQKKFGYNEESAAGVILRVAKRDAVTLDDN